MKIENMTLEQLNLELSRAKFWVKTSSIQKSLDLINKMENKRVKLLNKII